MRRVDSIRSYPFYPMPTESQIYARMDRYRDATLAAFEHHLRDIIQRAQNSTTVYILKRLDLTKGVIEATPANQRLIRNLNDVFMREMKHGGYSALVDEFVSSFPGQLPSIQATLKAINATLKNPLPLLDFSVRDLNLFQSVAASNAQAIRSTIAAEAAKAMTRVLFSVGGLRFSDMVATIRDGMQTTVARAKVLADTAQATWYRVALNRQYEKIEEDTGLVLRYRYSGPLDERCRVFCRRMMLGARIGKSYSREELEKMDNGSTLGNVFLYCGGWACRHENIPDAKSMSLGQQAA